MAEPESSALPGHARILRMLAAEDRALLRRVNAGPGPGECIWTANFRHETERESAYDVRQLVEFGWIAPDKWGGGWERIAITPAGRDVLVWVGTVEFKQQQAQLRRAERRAQRLMAGNR